MAGMARDFRAPRAGARGIVRPKLALAFAIAALSGCNGMAGGQRPAAPAQAPASADVAAIEAALDAVYAAISGPVGQPRDFARMRTLFTPDARLTAITPEGLRGGTLDDYVARSGAFLVSQGFSERGLVNRIEVYGDLAQAWSSFVGSFTKPDGTPGEVRGINSVQLVRQPDGCWLVQSILWQAATPGNPLPADMAGVR
jgi:ketosteroid isomerase-like protein